MAFLLTSGIAAAQPAGDPAVQAALDALDAAKNLVTLEERSRRIESLKRRLDELEEWRAEIDAEIARPQADWFLRECERDKPRVEALIVSAKARLAEVEAAKPVPLAEKSKRVAEAEARLEAARTGVQPESLDKRAPDGRLQSRVFYRADGKVERIVSYRDDGSPKTRERFDEEGRQVEETLFTAAGTVARSLTFDAKTGRVKALSYYGSSGKPETIWTNGERGGYSLVRLVDGVVVSVERIGRGGTLLTTLDYSSGRPARLTKWRGPSGLSVVSKLDDEGDVVSVEFVNYGEPPLQEVPRRLLERTLPEPPSRIGAALKSAWRAAGDWFSSLRFSKDASPVEGGPKALDRGFARAKTPGIDGVIGERLAKPERDGVGER